MTDQIMQPIKVQRYANQQSVDDGCRVMWQGCISPEGGAWFVFVDLDGMPHLYVREPQIVEGEDREPLQTIDEETGDVFEVLVCKWSPDRE